MDPQLDRLRAPDRRQPEAGCGGPCGCDTCRDDSPRNTRPAPEPRKPPRPLPVRPPKGGTPPPKTPPKRPKPGPPPKPGPDDGPEGPPRPRATWEDPRPPLKFPGPPPSDGDAPEDTPVAPGLLRPAKHTIRLGATLGGKDQLNRLDDLAPCEPLIAFIAHTFDEATFLHSMPATRTIPAIRELSSQFVGTLGVMPSAMTAASTLGVWNQEAAGRFGDDDDGLDRNRADPVFAVSYDPALDTPNRAGWAIRMSFPVTGQPPPGRMDVFPYPAFGKGKGTDVRVNDLGGIALPAPLASARKIKLTCEPEPFALHPVSGLDPFIRAVAASVRRYRAQGIFLDDMTPTYARPDDQNDLQKAVIILDRASCPSDVDFAGAQYAVRASRDMYEPWAYANYRPDVCKGAAASTDEANRCQDALRTDRLELIARARDAFQRDARGATPTLVWPNLYALLGNDRKGKSVVPQRVRDDEDREQLLGAHGFSFVAALESFDGLYASRADQMSSALANGGWWEKFTHDWDEVSKTGFAAYFDGLGVDTTRLRVLLPSGRARSPFVAAAIHRVAPTLGYAWRHAMKWVGASARTGARVRVESGFTSIDDVQMAIASYLLARIVPTGGTRPDAGPRSPITWPSLGEGRARGWFDELALAAHLTFFPRFLRLRGNTLLNCDAPGHRCHFECARRQESDATPRPFVSQAFSPMHPEVLRAVFAPGAASPTETSAMTPLRLLLDSVLGAPMDLGRVGSSYVGLFTDGEVVVVPFKDEQNVDNPITKDDVVRHRPRRPGLYMTIDAGAIDSIVGAGPVGYQAVFGRVPSWATEAGATGPDLRQVLEAGLQDAGHLALPFPRAGVPGITLRQTGGDSPDVRLLPGMGRVILYEGTETARLWRRYFPTTAPLGDRFVTQRFERFLTATQADRAVAAGRVDLTPRVFP